jgi:endonuclease/exonuclease/phosphatase family metal-dependent hydrolase
MKIYSWNMLFRNERQDEAFAFIAETQWDIFCLQEVPEEFLFKLRELPCELASAVETGRIYKGSEAKHYVVILSRFSIEHSESVLMKVPPNNISKQKNIHTRVFRKIMFSTGLWAKGVGDRCFLITHLSTPAGTLRVINLHLPLTTPAHRSSDFQNAMMHENATFPTLVCGDFNIVEKPHITVLNWLLGGTVADWIQFTRERACIEEQFSNYRLVNPLRGISTHPLSRSQLDHILVSAHFQVANAGVIRRRYGSDHHPIYATVA